MGGGGEIDDRDMRIWVGGLPLGVAEEEIQDKFSKFGKVKWIRVRSSHADTFCFIQYFTKEDAVASVDGMDQSPTFGAGKGGVIKVQLAKTGEREKGDKGRGKWKHKGRSRSAQRFRSGSRSSSTSSGSRASGSRSRSRKRSRSRSDAKSKGAGGGGRSRSRSVKSGGAGAGKGRGARGGGRASRSRSARSKGGGKGGYRARSPSWTRGGKGARPCSPSWSKGGGRGRWDSRSRGRGNGKYGGKGGGTRGATPPGRARSPLKRKGVKGPTHMPIVRIENLPADMDEEELSDIGTGFGRLVRVKVWDYNGAKFGKIEFERMEDAKGAAEQLHERKVEGASDRLQAFLTKMPVAR